ncbi:hypothetical protein GLAREA_07704 [Glarea lozoyensis ATCC 20868]|uniref:Uncharacterized protein n=1 Tax=Glarea lozoyensis (strain ATCC 20868 / MF5171) TaxID=1116229 RepID=S3D426_GLAL2|nr:uncharacterized protein GLAREA_07704 [Glarea lozoyensis ATCC 20868]EPE32570.1 hypothetical protein GLAREA_07704 [Glarea lozoyensis ATCC 20868]
MAMRLSQGPDQGRLVTGQVERVNMNVLIVFRSVEAIGWGQMASKVAKQPPWDEKVCAGLRCGEG